MKVLALAPRTPRGQGIQQGREDSRAAFEDELDLEDVKRRARFPGIMRVMEALELHGLSRPDVVFSGIPFSTMSTSLGRQIIQSVWSSLKPGGRFVAYQFRDRVAVLGREIAGRPQVMVEPLNVPPIHIYCWRKPDQ